MGLTMGWDGIVKRSLGTLFPSRWTTGYCSSFNMSGLGLLSFNLSHIIFEFTNIYDDVLLCH